MRFFGAFGPAAVPPFESSSNIFPTNNGACTNTAKAFDMNSEKGDLSSRASTYTGKSSRKPSFEDVSKDVELGLPTFNPQVERAQCDDSKDKVVLTHRHKLGRAMILACLVYMAMIVVVVIIPDSQGLRLKFALAMNNIPVINGTVNYGNGTIAPINDINLAAITYE
ncbi:hypothetical protein NHQ30_005074 [Ciborinia camelliae]|nr:hypothetical protein NHQ30_005074 [Ciborinia camelliae]